jgi:hypothetical protein
VNDVEIDPIGFEPLQARVDGRQDIAVRRALQRASVIHRQPALTRQHDVFAPRAQTLAENFFGVTAITVGVRGVDQGNAQIERRVNDLALRVKIDTVAAKIVAAQPHHEDFETGAA